MTHTTSDHIPLFLELKRFEVVRWVKQFKFENYWSKENDCVGVVYSSWELSYGMSIQERLRMCGDKLKGWEGIYLVKFRNE